MPNFCCFISKSMLFATGHSIPSVTFFKRTSYFAHLTSAMCCLCDCVKLAFSRCILLLLQLVMIVVATWCLVLPRNWTYLVLFKNDGTNISLSDSVHKVIANGVVDLFSFGTLNTSGPPTTVHPLVTSTATIFWCALLIVTNVFGYLAILSDSFVLLVLYAIAVVAYLLHAVNQYLATHSYLYIFDMAILGTVLFNVILMLIYDCICHCCCGVGAKISSSEDVQPLGVKPHHTNLRPTSVVYPLSYPNPPNMYGGGRGVWYQSTGQRSQSYYI